MLSTARTKSYLAMRLLLVVVAVAMACGFAYRRYVKMEQRRRAVAEAVRVNSQRRISPWEYMARTEGHIYLQRRLGSIRYPNSSYVDNPEHPVEVFFVSSDKPKTIADYYASHDRLKVKKTGPKESPHYESMADTEGSHVAILITPSRSGSTIQYSLPDMRQPSGQ